MNKVLNNYNLGEVKQIKKVDSGIMNETYIVETSDDKFILQEIKDKRITRDHQTLESIWNSDIQIPKQIKSNSGKLFHKQNGKTYRVITYIDNEDLETLTSDLCFKLGETLAEFHIQTSEFNDELEYSIPYFHNTRKIMNDLLSIRLSNVSSEKWSGVSEYYDTIISDIENLYLPHLPARLIHGDPKWQNFLYKNNKVTGIVDFETLMYANELIDIGDALRSWSKDEEYNFDKKRFDASIQGYLSRNSTVEESLIPRAAGLITLELSARFLIDYFNQEEFKLTESELMNKLQNQMKFYQDMKEQLKL